MADVQAARLAVDMPAKAKDKKKPAAAAANPQGISARGNALYRIVLSGLLVALIPVGLGLGFLATVREPSMQKNQLQRVSEAYARQTADGVHEFLQRVTRRIEAAATTPTATRSLSSGDQALVADVERNLLAFFPEVSTLRLVPLGEMGTAAISSGGEGTRNHIELDLLRRTGQGEVTQPESYEYEGQWLTSIARRVSSADQAGQQAVILVTFSNDILVQQLSGMDDSAGAFTLEQVYQGAENGRTTVVASAGSGDETDFARTFSVPESHWQVTFTPSANMVESLSPSPIALFAVLAVVAASVLAGFFVVLSMWPRRLAREVEKLIAAAERKTPLVLAVPELVDVAKQMRRATLRSMRQSGTSASSEPTVQFSDTPETGSDDLTNPLFQSTSILDEDEVLDLDLDEQQSMHAAAEDSSGYPSHIFRAYDIRGVADTELSDDMVAAIGGAIGTIAGEQDEQTLIVGCDGRNSSARIKGVLIKALMGCGRDVIDIGLVPTPLLYFATRHLNCRSGIMITGSHNPGDYNGLKVVLNQHTIAAGGIQQIRERAQQGKFSKGQGRMIREDVVEAYIDEVMSDIAIGAPLKVVIDAGNGATSRVAPTLFEALGCEVLPLYCEIDGNFPNHPPDTSNENNLADLIAAVQASQADLGVAFDGDGDRLAVVTGSGHIVRSDKLMMVFAQDVVSRNPGADVVFDVKCSRHLAELITRFGGRPVLWKTGHAFMKEKMLETGALLGGEFSGHIFFGERWYGFDDGMYAAARLAEILSTLSETLDEILSAFPQSVSTPEILVPVPESRKFKLVDDLSVTGSFSHGKVNHMDGVRVDFVDGWGLVRASNTTAALTARFEADSDEALENIKQEFRSQLQQVDPELELTF